MDHPHHESGRPRKIVRDIEEEKKPQVHRARENETILAWKIMEIKQQKHNKLTKKLKRCY